MKTALAIIVVLVVVFTGIPILMGLSDMGTCDECGPAVLLASCAAAILVGALLLMQASHASRVRLSLALSPVRRYGQGLERPPQLV